MVELVDGEKAIVSSIGTDGRVYFKGGKGYSAWPDLINRVLVRKDSHSLQAKKLRTDADNAAVLRKASANWSAVRSDDLSEFLVEGEATHDEIDELETIIARAKDEKPIQRFLEQHGHLLTALLGGKEKFCISQKRLGAEYIPDFVIGDTDSLGVRWMLVELETPRSRIYLRDANTLDKYARKGVDQIVDWRDWLSKNVAYAHRPLKSSGLGLYDIGGQSEGLVLVGRRALFPSNAKDSKRRALRESARLQVHTYDWLLERLRGVMSHQGSPATNPHLMHKAQGW